MTSEKAVSNEMAFFLFRKEDCMYKMGIMFVCVLCVACLAFMWGYIRGYEDRSDYMNWGAGWNDGYKAGQKIERDRHRCEELMKNLGTDGGE